MASKGNNVGKKLTALIVDDDRTSSYIESVIMRKFSFETTIVENGKDAIDLIQSGKHFDVILMDLLMPVMDGIEATQTLRTMGVNSMIIGVAALRRHHDGRDFMDAGLDRFYEKPLFSKTIATLYEEMVNNN